MPDDDLHPACVRVRVPGKVNLFLAVRGRRSDGYHELVTVMQTVSLFDELVVGLAGPPGRGQHPAGRRRMGVELRTDGTDGLPDGAENLAVLAARALGRAGGLVTAVEQSNGSTRTVMTLRKGIPVAGGMAGGSADAAAALVGLNRLWETDLQRDALSELAAELGSDVPFCVVGGTAIATGSGTALAQVLCRGTFSWVVCTSAVPLATSAVYRAWDRACEPSEVEPDAVLAALRQQDAVALGAALHNDLEPAAFTLRPELGESRAALLDAGALGAVVSGSGPTLLALCESDAEAERIAEAVRPRFAGAVTARSPVGGPELRAC